NLVVTRNADFDTESNDSFITTPAQYLVRSPAGQETALGHVGGPTSINNLTFDELPFQPVNGLHFKDVTFGFTIGDNPSTDAFYHDTLVGTVKYVQDPCLEGNTRGVLSLTFDAPTSAIDFGVALSTGGTVANAVQVELFDASGTSLGTTPITTHNEGFFYTEA